MCIGMLFCGLKADGYFIFTSIRTASKLNDRKVPRLRHRSEILPHRGLGLSPPTIAVAANSPVVAHAYARHPRMVHVGPGSDVAALPQEIWDRPALDQAACRRSHGHFRDHFQRFRESFHSKRGSAIPLPRFDVVNLVTVLKLASVYSQRSLVREDTAAIRNILPQLASLRDLVSLYLGEVILLSWDSSSPGTSICRDCISRTSLCYMTRKMNWIQTPSRCLKIYQPPSCLELPSCSLLLGNTQRIIIPNRYASTLLLTAALTGLCLKCIWIY
ncbi:hypothetical protein BDZ89DRAFT_119889 [Hymenopellis radicata]|nr:hypothetical protein BDZ89DRAFT_119889 [Hymenopellis radicata]